MEKRACTLTITWVGLKGFKLCSVQRERKKSVTQLNALLIHDVVHGLVFVSFSFIYDKNFFMNRARRELKSILRKVHIKNSCRKKLKVSLTNSTKAWQARVVFIIIALCCFLKCAIKHVKVKVNSPS